MGFEREEVLDINAFTSPDDSAPTPSLDLESRVSAQDVQIAELTDQVEYLSKQVKVLVQAARMKDNQQGGSRSIVPLDLESKPGITLTTNEYAVHGSIVFSHTTLSSQKVGKYLKAAQWKIQNWEKNWQRFGRDSFTQIPLDDQTELVVSCAGFNTWSTVKEKVSTLFHTNRSLYEDGK